MGKKGRKQLDDDDWLAEMPADPNGDVKETEEEAEAPAAKPKKEKKKKEKKGGKKAAAFDSDEDEPQLGLPPAAEEEEEEEEEEAPLNQTKQKGGKKKKGGAPAGGSVFALLNGDGSEAEQEEDEEEEEEAPAARTPVMCVAEILSVAPHPKADRLRVCQVDAGGAATVKVVTNAQNVEEGMKVVFAPVGCTTRSCMKIEQAVLRGVESFGMLCSAHECGWVAEPDGVLVVMPDDAEVGEECPDEPPEGAIYGVSASKKEKKKEKKKKAADTDSHFALLGDEGGADGQAEAEEEEAPAPTKGKKDKKKKKGEDVASAFAALSVEEGGEEAEEEEEQEQEPAPAKGKKDKKKEKKKKVAEADSLFALLGGDEGEAEEEEEEEEKPAKKEKEKKKGKKAYADIDVAALLAADEEAAEAGEAAPAPTGKKDKKKDKKKGKAAAKEEEEDLDALLAELDGGKPAAPAARAAPAAEAAPASGGKKDKKKKKGKGGAAKDEDEDFDSILAELGAKPEEQQQAAAAAPAAPTAEQQQQERPDSPEDEEGEGGEEGGDKEMSAAAKKKAKKKAKEKAKKAAAAGEGEGEEAAEAPAAGGKGKKGPKVSAAVRRMQEAIEAQRRAQEEAERLAEEQRRKEEEEERLRLEEEQRKKEEAERKKREKAERREQLKREGKLLSGKAKEEAERRARAAALFLQQAGINPDELPKKKPVYSSKKKPQKKKPQQDEAAAAAEAEQPAAEQQEAAAASPAAAAAEEPAPMEAEAAPAPAEAAPAAEAAAEEPVDSWEDAADDWEAMDVDQIKLPGQQAQAGEEEEEEPAPAPAANGKAKAAASAAKAKADAAVKAADAELAAAKAAVEAEGSEEEEESSEEESSDEESSSEEGSSSEDDSSDDDSSDYSSSEEESDSEDERERRLAAARERREAKLQEALQARDPKDLRSPICCILGHVDTGKTKILDNIRRTNVQDGEAGGITQQIGATYIPNTAIETRTEELRKGRQFDLKLPGLLVIDTPGHESFSNLRSRGSGLCDIAILVVDLMHGLEQQTIESINLLKMRKTPFIIAMNKVDRLYNWNSVANSPIQDAFARQEEYVRKEFEDRLNSVMLQLNEQGLNVALYWKNRDPRTFINIVPTSAITGEGIPDLLQLVVKLTQSLMVERLMFVNNLECTVLEVKQIEGLGTTIDVVLVNGMLKEGDTIVVCGLGGPIVTTIRALLTPQPLREIRVKGQYVHHKELRAAMGVKIAAHNLESAVAGTQLYVVGPDDDVEDLKDAVMEDMQDIFSSVDKTGEGVCVQASTLGSLEALLEFLKSDDVRIPVSSINIGPINKKDVMRANAMIERGHKKFGVILAFDVPVTRDAATLAEQLGVRIFTADIIYHLFDQFTAYLKQVKEEEQEAAKLTAVFPCVLKIIPTCIFNQKDPIILGVEVVEGIAKVGTPICVPSRGGVDLGRIASLEKDHKPVDTARRGDAVAMKIEATKPEEASRSYERHFDHRDELMSRITRKSINVLKEMFRDDLSKDDWRLVIKLKKIFKID